MLAVLISIRRLALRARLSCGPTPARRRLHARTGARRRCRIGPGVRVQLAGQERSRRDQRRWPDQAASYWAAPFYSAPGTEITIRGSSPLARDMSFHVYEGGAAVSAVTDQQITPSSGTNPYLPGARRVSGGKYVLHLVFGPKPADPAPNTLYAGSLNGEPNVAGLLMYRLYLSEGDATGGVPLPQVDYTNAATGVPLPCPDTSGLDSSTLNQQIVAGSMPTDTSVVLATNLSWGSGQLTYVRQADGREHHGAHRL